MSNAVLNAPQHERVAGGAAPARSQNYIKRFASVVCAEIDRLAVLGANQEWSCGENDQDKSADSHVSLS